MRFKFKTDGTSAPYNYCDSVWVSGMERIDNDRDILQQAKELFNDWVHLISTTPNFMSYMLHHMNQGAYKCLDDYEFLGVVILENGKVYATYGHDDCDGLDEDDPYLYCVEVNLNNSCYAGNGAEILYAFQSMDSNGVHFIPKPLYRSPMSAATWKGILHWDQQEARAIIRAHNTNCVIGCAVIGAVQYCED